MHKNCKVVVTDYNTSAAPISSSLCLLLSAGLFNMLWNTHTPGNLTRFRSAELHNGDKYLHSK